LLNTGIAVNVTEHKGHTALMYACYDQNRLDNVKTLIKHNADVNQVNNAGVHALHFS
jgi:ankyrin repeat protein